MTLSSAHNLHSLLLTPTSYSKSSSPSTCFCKGSHHHRPHLCHTHAHVSALGVFDNIWGEDRCPAYRQRITHLRGPSSFILKHISVYLYFVCVFLFILCLRQCLVCIFSILVKFYMQIRRWCWCTIGVDDHDFMTMTITSYNFVSVSGKPDCAFIHAFFSSSL